MTPLPITRETAATVRDPWLADQLAEHLDHGRTVLVATLSGALLGRLVTTLRRAGIPHRDLTTAAPDPTLAAAIAAYLLLDEREQPEQARAWTGDDVRAWWWLCQPGRAGIAPDAARLVSLLPGARPVPFEVLADLWRDDRQRARALEPDPHWLLDAAKPGYRPRLAPLVALAEHNGPAALRRAPRLLVGTVHAAAVDTAGAAGAVDAVDVVYLCPDLTPAQADEWWSGHRARLAQFTHRAGALARLEVVWLAPATRYALPNLERTPR